jgi:hypothetical protein
MATTREQSAASAALVDLEALWGKQWMLGWLQARRPVVRHLLQ